MLNLSSKILNETKDLNELAFIENRNKISFLLFLLIEIIKKESKQIISSIKKIVLIFF
jgi:hypothetical protein